MKRVLYCVLLVLVLLLSTVYAEDLIWLGRLSPSEANICGQGNSEVVEIVASEIRLSEMNSSVSNLVAELVSDKDGLIFLGPSEVILGNLDYDSSIAFNASWVLKCNPAMSGSYNLYVKFKDNSTDLGSSLSYRTAKINVVSEFDSKPPVVLSHKPDGLVSSSYTNLVVETDEDATCKYDTRKDINYENMQQSFDVTGGKHHEEGFKDLGNNVYHFYVKCRDKQGNKAVGDYDASFQFNTPPSAKIVLDGGSTLKGGMVNVQLIPSEELAPNPELKYSFDNNNWNKIPLTYSKGIWVGSFYLDNLGNKIGYFQFNGKDLSDNVGELITEGNTFIVDGVAPKINSFNLSQEGDSFELSWDSLDKDIDYFEIYRSTNSEAGTFLTKVTESRFIDDNLVGSYYYKVRAIDKAGNIGEFSEVVYGNAGEVVSQPIINVQEPVQTYDFKSEVTALTREVERVEREYGYVDQNYLNLVSSRDESREIRDTLTRLKGDLNALDPLTDVSGSLSLLESDFNALKVKIPKTVSVVEESNFGVSSGLEEDFKPIFDKLLLIDGLTEGDIKSVMDLQNEIQSTGNVKILNVIYMDGHSADFTVVNKRVLNLNGKYNLVEQLPNDLASMVSYKGDYSLVDGNSVVRFVLDGTDVEYVFNSYVALDSIKNIKSYVVPDLAKTESGNEITGYFAMGNFSGDTGYNFAIIIGIIFVLGLTVYYLRDKRKRDVATEVVPAISVITKGYNEIKDDKILINEYGLIDLKDVNFHSLINKANLCINHLQCNEAIELYNKFMSGGAVSGLSEKEREKLQAKLERVYKKILLCTKVNDAYASITTKDFGTLAAVLNEIADHYNGLIEDLDVQEIELLKLIRDYHQNYSKVLIENRLGLEKK